MKLDVDALLDALAERVALKLPRPDERALEHAFMKRGTFAKRIDVSERTLDGLIARGLPTIGKGRLLRIDVASADRWLREHLSDDVPETEDEVSRAAQASVDKALRGNR